MNDRKPIPIGYDDFKNLRNQEYYFVDKSLFIKEILLSGASISLITRPRRFGKTLNMSMLRYFLDCHEKNSEPLFHDLEILNETSICEKFMNKHPVFSISFKDINYYDEESFFTRMGLLLASELQNYTYLLDSEKLTQIQKKTLMKFLSRTADHETIGTCLLWITQILQTHHGMLAFLLIDEYDLPIHSAYENHKYEECIKWMRIIYGSCLKGNPHIHKAVITGILRISKESMLSGLIVRGCFGKLRERAREPIQFT